MTRYHGKDGYLSYAATVLSTYLTEISLSINGETADVTTMGDSWVERLAGMKDWSADVSGIWEAGAGTPDTILFPLINTSNSLIFKANSAAVGPTNPTYTGNAILTTFEVPAAIGDAVQFSATFEGNGALTRAEA